MEKRALIKKTGLQTGSSYGWEGKPVADVENPGEKVFEREDQKERK